MYNKMLSESTECELTDNSPDIVHLFGMPTEKMIADAKRFNRAEVPVAYSPMGAYMLTGKRIKPKLAFIHTFGPKEAEIISRLKMKLELIWKVEVISPFLFQILYIYIYIYIY